MCKLIGSRLVWATSNFIVFACMAATAVISFISVKESSTQMGHTIGGNESIKIASLIVFAILGFPLSVSLSPLSACYAYKFIRGTLLLLSIASCIVNLPLMSYTRTLCLLSF